MIGAIVGDIVGSVYEWHNIKTKDFPFFRPDCFFITRIPSIFFALKPCLLKPERMCFPAIPTSTRIIVLSLFII